MAPSGEQLGFDSMGPKVRGYGRTLGGLLVSREHEGLDPAGTLRRPFGCGGLRRLPRERALGLGDRDDDSHGRRRAGGGWLVPRPRDRTLDEPAGRLGRRHQDVACGSRSDCWPRRA